MSGRGGRTPDGARRHADHALEGAREGGLGAVAEEFEAGLGAERVPADVVALLRYLFTEVLDGRNEGLTDGVRRALGREPRDFADYAARSGVCVTVSERRTRPR